MFLLYGRQTRRLRIFHWFRRPLASTLNSFAQNLTGEIVIRIPTFNRAARLAACGFAALLHSSIARAAVPTYSHFQLQVRSNLCANPAQGTENIPCDHFFGNGTPVINNAGQWCVKLDVMGSTGKQGILYGVNGTAQIVYSSQVDDTLSDPWINNNGRIVWPQYFSAQNGLFKYDVATASAGPLTAEPFGAQSWGSVVVNDSNQVGYRATFSGSVNGWYSWQSGAAVPHAQQGAAYAFLFSPHMNNARQLAGKTTTAGAQDQIRRINVDATNTLIAVDRDTNPTSPYTGFDASRPAIADDGRVAFIANLFAGGRGVFLSDGTTTITIATTTSGQGVSDIEFFPPDVNNAGLVVFRAKDAGGLRAIWVGDGVTLRRVIGEHDIVPSDNGPARIDQNDSSPTFGGAPTINDRGDVAFHCTLTPPDNNQIEWGSAIYIAYAQRVGDVNNDGFVNVSDLLAVITGWGACPTPPPPPANCPADINGDGTVNVADLLLMISNWG